ncbi:hypothetical protein [Peptoniphilus raoultii]|uniref:hypothetical protein n=1 Tax=Peptoniphilus raoultii TaxID=1776387 RepID=UPI001FD6963D|nr:hypothetical protein [Peptoniphilus raoultii]
MVNKWFIGNNFCLFKYFLLFKGKRPKFFRFLSLALTAITLCFFYRDAYIHLNNKDWSGLMDIVPTMSKALFILTFASIIINGLSLFKAK